MKRTLIAFALVAATVTACSKEKTEAPPAESAAVASEAVTAADAASAPHRADRAAEAAPPPGYPAVLPQQPSSKPIALDLPSLAYAYAFKLEAPGQAIPDMMRRHEQLCIDSGPTQCQVLGSNLDSEGHDEATGKLEMRATQSWVRMFRPGLEADARDAGGELRGSGTDTEDLTRPIADTDAVLKSKIEVRDRLRGMLKRPGRLDDVMEIERELQRVQAEIDATTSALKEMNTRVEAVRVTVDYASVAPIAPEGAFKPFKQASGAFVRTFMGVLAAIAWVAAVALPFVIVFGPVVWMVANRRKKPVAAE